MHTDFSRHLFADVPQPQTPREKDPFWNTKNTLIISGAVAGVLFFIGILIGGLCRVCCRKRRKQGSEHPQPPNIEDEEIYDNIHERMATATVLHNNDAFHQNGEVEFVLQNNPAY